MHRKRFSLMLENDLKSAAIGSVSFWASSGSQLSKCRRKGNIWDFKKWQHIQIVYVCVHTLTLSQTHTHISLFIQNIWTYRFLCQDIRFCLASYKSNVIKTLQSCGVLLCYVLSDSYEWERPLEPGQERAAKMIRLPRAFGQWRVWDLDGSVTTHFIMKIGWLWHNQYFGWYFIS